MLSIVTCRTAFGGRRFGRRASAPGGSASRLLALAARTALPWIAGLALVGGALVGPATAHAQPTAPPTPPASSSAAPLMPPPAAPVAAPPPAAPPVEPSQPAPEPPKPARRVIDASVAGSPQEVFSDDWWGRTRPVLELHGYFRTRGELFHNFALGRHENSPGDPHNLWGQPLDHSYADSSGKDHAVALCPNEGTPPPRCIDKTQSTANLRFRLEPELHISDNLRILAQIDALDNLVLGSTPDAYAMRPSASSANGSGYATAGYNGYAPLGVFSTTQGPPTAGVNGYRNSIDVKRVWGEYTTPVGQLRFGRMPNHWGLGMVANAGQSIDSDYHSTSDRIMFVSGAKSIDLYFGGMWDFVSTGPSSASAWNVYGGQPYNTGNLTNVDQWGAFIAHRTNPELRKLQLARGEVVLDGGLFAVYRKQLLDVPAGDTPQTANVGADASNRGLERRGAQAFIPDLWLQLLWRKFRFEAEFASVYGEIEHTPALNDIANPVKVRMYGLTTQTEYRTVEDKLRLQFGFGWASGDPWVRSLNPGQNGLLSPLNGRGPISTFSFHPDYRVDLIFFRRILSRVEGAYYFRPSVDYDFVRHPNGQKFGGGAAIIWSRASEFMQTPGHKRDLGVELDLQLYYQAKDGSLNDDPEKIGGFYSMLQYGVFFPLGGLEYLPAESAVAQQQGVSLDLATAQTIRLFLGIAF